MANKQNGAIARKTVNLVTLGCSKNLVDSERALRMRATAG